MPKNMSMPRLSDTMEVGTIVKWHVKPGQKVKSGQVIADIETDKATMELQTFDDGVVAELVVAEGKSCPVGQMILRWEGGQEGAGGTAGAAGGAGASSGASAVAAVVGGRSGAGGADPGVAVLEREAARERVFASPLARKIAADNNIDLSAIAGSGPSGRVIRRDVEAVIAGGVIAGTGTQANGHAWGNGAGFANTADPIAALARHGGATVPAAPAVPIFKPKPLPATPLVSAAQAATSVPPIAALMMPSIASALERQSVPLSNMRRTIAARLVESKQTIPHYQVTVGVRMDALLDLRKQLNDQLGSQGVKLSVNDFIVRACALAMHAHPHVNSRWNPAKGAESIELLDQVNIGVAISLPAERGGGLVVATLRQADAKGLRLISQESKALAEKARTKGLTIEEMGDSTFTISNLGMFGVDHFTAIINPPNAAILAVGAAIEQPVVETDASGKKSVGVGHVMSMTMSSDHRIVDGAMAAHYLQTVRQMLEKPATLLV
jgi:pyruvate dehydrogenase E2 component (dihydrolipoamide acetyltransferase)